MANIQFRLFLSCLVNISEKKKVFFLYSFSKGADLKDSMYIDTLVLTVLIF